MAEYIGGQQEVRVDSLTAKDNPDYTVTIAKGGTYTVDQYALLYFGKDQPKKQEVIFNSTLSNKPYLAVGYEEKSNEVYVYAKDIYHNITDAEAHLGKNDNYVFGLGIVKKWTDEYNYYYALGSKAVKYWDGDEFRPLNVNGEFTYGLVGGNSIEIKNTTDH
jgi:hypothetical protein